MDKSLKGNHWGRCKYIAAGLSRIFSTCFICRSQSSNAKIVKCIFDEKRETDFTSYYFTKSVATKRNDDDEIFHWRPRRDSNSNARLSIFLFRSTYLSGACTPLRGDAGSGVHASEPFIFTFILQSSFLMAALFQADLTSIKWSTLKWLVHVQSVNGFVVYRLTKGTFKHGALYYVWLISTVKKKEEGVCFTIPIRVSISTPSAGVSPIVLRNTNAYRA